MRYVIAVCLLTGLIVWDGARNDGRLLDHSVRAMKQTFNYFGASI